MVAYVLKQDIIKNARFLLRSKTYQKFVQYGTRHNNRAPRERGLAINPMSHVTCRETLASKATKQNIAKEAVRFSWGARQSNIQSCDVTKCVWPNSQQYREWSRGTKLKLQVGYFCPWERQIFPFFYQLDYIPWKAGLAPCFENNQEIKR